MAKRPTSKKHPQKTRKAPQLDAAVPATRPESKPRKVRERDPRLPAAGTVIVRKHKGKEHRVKVLEDSFELDGKAYRSLTALAKFVTGYAAISGPAWAGLTGPQAAKAPTVTETPATAKKTRAPKTKRAVRDPKPETKVETTTDAGSAAETAPESATA